MERERLGKRERERNQERENEIGSLYVVMAKLGGCRSAVPMTIFPMTWIELCQQYKRKAKMERKQLS